MSGNRPFVIQAGRLESSLPGRRAAAQFVPLRGSLPAVDPTITAAWISGGVGALGIVSTAVTAWIGTRNTRKATEQAIAAGADNTRAMLAAAREDRLWERRAAAYEETLTAVLHRQAEHRNKLRRYRLDDKSEQLLKDWLASYSPPGWFEAEARLLAYASDKVVTTFEETEQAKIAVWELHLRRLTIAEDNRLAAESGNPAGAHDGDVATKVRNDMDKALAASETKDLALITLIREELRSKPEAAL